ERSDIHRVGPLIGAALHEIEKVTIVREEERQPHSGDGLTGRNTGHRDETPAAVADPIQAAAGGGDENRMVAIPGCARTVVDGADLLRGAAGDINLDQIDSGEKADPSTVRRPERVARAFGVGKRP